MNSEQAIEAMLTATGAWVTLQTWNINQTDFDAQGWLEVWAGHVGKSSAPLPCGGMVDLSAFCAVREKRAA